MERHDVGAGSFHGEDGGLLPLDVGHAHIDDARDVEEGAGRRRRAAVLAGASLGDDPPLFHAAGQQYLTEAVVDLVRAGMVELVAFQIELGAAEMAGEPPGGRTGARPAAKNVEGMSQPGRQTWGSRAP